MAHREVGIVDVREVLRRILGGEKLARISEASGWDRKTLRRYRDAARAEGLSLSGAPPTDEEIARVIVRTRGTREAGPGATERLLLEHKERIEAWLGPPEDLRLTKVRDLLSRQGVCVAYSSLHRFATKFLGFGGPSVTVRVAPTEPGEAATADWGRLGKLLDPVTGQMRWVQALIVTLSHSRHQFVHLSFTMTAKDLIEGFEGAWNFFGGVPKRVVIDNQKAAVAKADRYRPEMSREFTEYTQFRGFLLDPTRPRHPKDNPFSERGVRYLRESFWKGEVFLSLEETREKALAWCMTTAGTRIHGTTRRAPLAVFEAEEKTALLPLAPEAFDTPRWVDAKVHPDHHIQFERALYSVPTAYVGRKVAVRGDSRLVKVYDGVLCVKTHARRPPGGRSTDYDDYPKELRNYAARSPERLIREAGRFGKEAETFARKLLSGTFPWARLRQAQKLVRLGERYGAERLDAAARRALAFDLIDVGRLERILTGALEKAEGPKQGLLLPLPARFARDPRSFSQREKKEESDGDTGGSTPAAQKVAPLGDARNPA